jgi:hypothetical protein
MCRPSGKRSIVAEERKVKSFERKVTLVIYDHDRVPANTTWNHVRAGRDIGLNHVLAQQANIVGLGIITRATLVSILTHASDISEVTVRSLSSISHHDCSGSRRRVGDDCEVKVMLSMAAGVHNLAKDRFCLQPWRELRARPVFELSTRRRST